MILWRNDHFLSFNTNPRFPPFLLYVRCKLGVTFVWKCFSDVTVEKLHPKDAEGMANTADPDQTPPIGTVYSEITLFAWTYQYKNL